jgi:putative intracellular protease/amidase
MAATRADNRQWSKSRVRVSRDSDNGLKREPGEPMTNEALNGLKVAILVTDGFEQVELERPAEGTRRSRRTDPDRFAQGRTRLLWKFREWGDQLLVDVPLDQANPQDFDALLLPGGLVNLDALRVQPKAMAFAKAFFDAGKPVAAICRRPWTITEINAAHLPRKQPPSDVLFLAAAGIRLWSFLARRGLGWLWRHADHL